MATLTWDDLKVPTRTTTDTAGITDPKIYADIVDFGGHTWQPRVKISNNEGQLLYFQVKPRPGASQPPRYTINTTNLGSVAHGATTEFTNWAGIECTAANAPTSGDIPSGATLEETVYLRLEAYTDAGYTNSFGYADFDITFTWIDSNSAGWTVVDTDDFDDGTAQGWTGDAATVDPDFYRSAPYSLRCKFDQMNASGWVNHYKPFTIGNVSRAFAVLYYRTYKVTTTERHETEIKIGGTTKHKFRHSSDEVWYKIVVPMPLNAANELRIRTYGAPGAGAMDTTITAWLDNVKVVQS